MEIEAYSDQFLRNCRKAICSARGAQMFGMFLILLGIFILVLSLPFIEYYNSSRGYLGSMRQMEVVFAPGEFQWKDAIRDGLFSGETTMEKYPPRYYKGRITLKYRYVFAVAVSMIFAGLIMSMFLWIGMSSSRKEAD